MWKEILVIFDRWRSYEIDNYFYSLIIITIIIYYYYYYGQTPDTSITGLSLIYSLNIKGTSVPAITASLRPVITPRTEAKQ